MSADPAEWLASSREPPRSRASKSTSPRRGSRAPSACGTSHARGRGDDARDRARDLVRAADELLQAPRDVDETG
ncbi:hypothetical protein DB32_000535 [Sandaracinus amylolyticus]|uniref:Uncharacterized protein n=1 Tax=Sandaracinus amylolyticus TaxID=927083 RepID=A0A0F6VZ81_9BACT|nr:hypothetical protein DB32_000535 [Sandaracinus amylolyticus]